MAADVGGKLFARKKGAIADYRCDVGRSCSGDERSDGSVRDAQNRNGFVVSA